MWPFDRLQLTDSKPTRFRRPSRCFRILPESSRWLTTSRWKWQWPHIGTGCFLGSFRWSLFCWSSFRKTPITWDAQNEPQKILAGQFYVKWFKLLFQELKSSLLFSKQLMADILKAFCFLWAQQFLAPEKRKPGSKAVFFSILLMVSNY